MCRACHIVPLDVLRRLAEDKALSADQRKSFLDTSRIDVERRRMRAQVNRLTQTKFKVDVPAAGITVAPAPAITVFDCAHSMTLPGAPVADPATSADATAKRVYTETSSVIAFYAQVFGRNSVDGGGGTLVSSIHYGSSYNNAFWNGTQMTYGDGDGSIFLDFSRGNDVIAHEMTHGVTQHSLQLNYVNEAGGLNESLSDCFGSMFRQWEAKQDVTEADWLIGKDIIGPAAAKRKITCLRDMADPAAKHCLAPQPTQFSQYAPGMDPHLSSGIPNLAFCRIAKAVGGQSWDKVGQVWYRAMTGFGPRPAMKMKAFANRTRAVCAQLYSGDTALAHAADAGWKSVGL